MITKALPSLRFLPDDEVPADLSEDFLKSLEHLMKAQAEECGWQNAKLGILSNVDPPVLTLRQASVKNGLVARLAQKSLLDNVAKDIARAERDNDLIYHQDVPAHSALPEIVIASLIPKIEPPTGLTQIHTLISDDQVLFKDLLAWAAREAISAGTSDWLTPSLLKKAEEVRLANGPATINASIEDVQRLAKQDMDILNEVFSTSAELLLFVMKCWCLGVRYLDEEASEDEALRKEGPLPRPPSHEAKQFSSRKPAGTGIFSRKQRRATSLSARSGMIGNRTLLSLPGPGESYLPALANTIDGLDRPILRLLCRHLPSRPQGA
ncbi:pH-response regulator protein [Salix suchowensis]|nr:pH-response regulator protein [Salix suchowensis]